MKQYGRASLRRCLAALFAALMVFSVLPLTAMAEGIEGPSDNAARAAVGGDAEALAIGGEERSNATTVYYKPVTSIDTSKQYLITTTDNGTVYAMTSGYYSSNSNLKAASLTAGSNGYIQASGNTAIDNTYLWTFSTTSGGNVTNVSTGTQLYFDSSSITLKSSGTPLVYSRDNLYYSYLFYSYYLSYSSSGSYFTTSSSSNAATITLYEKVKEEVEVNPPVHAMAPNATKQLTAVVYPTNAANKNVTWTSDNNDVATVDSTGLVTAKAVGKATITATTEDGGHTDTCVVTVTNNATKEVTMFVNTLHAVPDEDYLIGYTTESGDTYIMSNEVSQTSYLAAAGATRSTVGDVCGITDSTACITVLTDGSEIPQTHQWYFGADADLGYTTIQNRATDYYLQRAAGSTADTYVGLSTAQTATTTGNQSWARGTTSEGDVTFIYHSNSSNTSYHFVTLDTTNVDFRTYYNTEGKGYTVDLYVKRTVTVEDSSATPTPTPAPVNVTIEPAELTVLLNGSGTLTATANIPESATDISYAWTSDKESVATVASAEGTPLTATVTPAATGTATITCTVTYNEGDAQQTLTATAIVNVVENYQVASITVPPEISLEPDEETQITPVVVTAPKDGVYGTDYTIEYVCDNESVADITANGGVFTVKAKSTGTVTVTFTAINSHDSTQRVSGSTVITVKEADSIPAPETGEGGGEKPIYKKVYVLVDDVEEADGNYIIATSNSAGDAYALYDNGSSIYVQRGSVTIQSDLTGIYGAYGKYIEPDSDSYVWRWLYNSTSSTYGRRGQAMNIGTKRGLYNDTNGYATLDEKHALHWYSISTTSPAAHYIKSTDSSYLGYYSSTYPYGWYTSSSNATPFYFYKEMIVQTGTEPVDSGVEIYLDGEKISQKEKAIEGVVQEQESTVTLTGTPVNIPAGAADKSAVWTLTKTDGAIESVDSNGVVTLAGSLGYGIIEITYTYTYNGTTYTVKNYTKLVVSSFKPMTGTGQTVTKKTIYKLVDSLTDDRNYIIVNGSSAAGTKQALKPGGDNSTLFSGTFTPQNGGTATPYTVYIVGDGEVVVNAADSVSSANYIETDDSNVVWRYSAENSSTANYGRFTNVGTARMLTFDNELQDYTDSYGNGIYMLTANDKVYTAWYYSNNKIYIPNGSNYAGIYTNKVSGGGYRLYTSAPSTSSSSLQSFYIFEETEIETVVDNADVSVDIYDGSKLVSGGVVSVNDTSSTLPLTAQTNYNGTGQIAWSIISGENIASIDQNGVVTFAANTSGKVLVQVTFTFDNGKTATNYVTLDVRSGGQLTDTSDRDNFPEYPNEGSVRLEKTADADETEFAKTGVGTVELFVRGVPVQSKGVDVVLVVDTSGSMKDDLTGATATSGNDKMSIAKAAAINFANTLLTVTNPDGTTSYTDNRLAVVSFASDASVMTGTSPLVADSRALVSVSSSSHMSSITTAINSMSANGGTNYDAAFKAAYDILRDAQEQGGDRKQYVVFVTDGAPGTYNNAELNSATFPKAGSSYYTSDDVSVISAQWYNWTQGGVPVWSSMPTAAAANFAEYAYADNIYAAAIKGTTFAGSNFKDSWKTNLDITSMLGAGIYGISLGMKGGSGIVGFTTDSSGTLGWTKFTSAQCTNLINRLCNKDIFAADSTEELTAAFEKIGKEVLQAGTNATVRDTIGADYDLQIEPFNYIDTANPRETDFESSIEVRKYTVDGNGNRTGAYETIEKVTFNAAGTEAYSTLKTGNIMTLDGENYTITAENFTYTSSNKRFVWKFDTIISDDMAIRFNVYLTGTREGSREGGLYDTNSWANLTYTNYLGTDCRLTFEKPALPWQNARVTYKFFLVDESGRPVNKDGVLVNYANLTYVGTEKTIKLGDAAFVATSDGRYSVELSAAALKALQSELSAYKLYDESAAVTINTDTTGTWGGYSITKGNTPDTTAVWPKPGADAKFDTVAVADGNNFTNVTVAFAVVFNVKLIPDAVVIDFGLPVDINVMQNDLVSQVSGQLYGLTLETEAAPDFASAYTTPVASVTTVGGKLNLTYGHATIRNDTTIRYTPSSMQMNQPEVFGYEVKGTSEADGTITTKYIRSTVTVIPATTIYYEDNFSNSDGTSYITYNNGVSEWELVGDGVSGTVVQDTDYVGSGNNYGYDSHYDHCATFSLNQAHKVTVTKAQYESILADSTKTWPTASFRFTGKGFDVISLTNAKTGMIMVQVKDKNGDIVRSVFVDTYYSGEVVEVNGNLYQIPVINIYDLPHGTYDVTITVPYLEMFDHTGSNGQPSGSYDMYIDGIRIYNPAGDDTTAHGAYTEDDEAYPYVQELRNMMIAAASSGQLSGPVFVDGNAATADASVYQSDGPNNEVYLKSGQAIVFALQTVGTTKPAGVYVSMKSPTGEVKVRYGSVGEKVSESTGLKYEERNMVTTSDMYYEIPENVLSWEQQANGRWKTKVAVQIANISDKAGQILALTNLKVTYASAPTNNGEVRFTTTQQQSQVAYTQIRDLMAELYADSYDTEIRSAAFATRTIDVNKTTELNVVTSTDANALIIRDKKGNVITPESISYEDKDGERHWKLTMTHKVSGIYIYKVSVEAAYGIMTDTPATVVAYVVPRSVVRPKPSMPKPPLFGWM